MKYHFQIKKQDSGYWAKCVELEGCSTQAEDLESLKKSAEEALNLFLDEPPDTRTSFPLPKNRCKGRGIIQVTVHPKVALAFILRRIRLERNLTQSEAAKLLGLKGLYSYQRLESSKTANPEFETIIKIKKAFPEIEWDELLAA